MKQIGLESGFYPINYLVGSLPQDASRAGVPPTQTPNLGWGVGTEEALAGGTFAWKKS